MCPHILAARVKGEKSRAQTSADTEVQGKCSHCLNGVFRSALSMSS